MPLYLLTCPECGSTQRRILKCAADADIVPCRTSNCQANMRRTPNPPSVHSKEVLCFGHQVRDVERFDDAEKLYDERAHQDDRKPK